jgi:hypothetical protein
MKKQFESIGIRKGSISGKLVSVQNIPARKYTVRCTDLLFPHLSYCEGAYYDYDEADNAIKCSAQYKDTERFKHTIEKISTFSDLVYTYFDTGEYFTILNT